MNTSRNENALHFVDTTLRDAHQSLWNGRMTTDMMLPIASTIEAVGFEAVDFMAMVSMDWCVRFQGENPWHRMRAMHRAMPSTPLIVGGVLRNFGNVPDAVTAFWIKACANAGARRIRINDPFHDIDQIKKAIAWSRDAGLSTLVAIIYTDSPVHTDEYFVAKARAIAHLGADRLFIKDVDGLLTPQRVSTLVPAIARAIDGMPLELHGHCNTGLAPLCYLEAIKLGIRTVHTAVAPLANGASQPNIDNILANAQLLGYRANLDRNALQRMTEHFHAVAVKEGLPLGAPVEFDAFQFEHQLPGGMMSNFQAELQRRGLGEQRVEVLREIATIRRELGFPIMVTPLSQYVGAQAVLNVTTGERYRVVTDELIHYMLGHYGDLAAPVDEAVRKRVLALPRALALKDWRPEDVPIESIRAKYRQDMDDEEFLMRVLASNEPAVDAMLAGATRPSPQRSPRIELEHLIRELERCTHIDSVQINCDRFHLRVTRT